MVAVGIRELSQKTSELIRMVRKEGQELQVTYRGDVVALVIPVTRAASQDIESAWDNLDTLAAEIGANWPNEVSSVDAVTEGRA